MRLAMRIRCSLPLVLLALAVGCCGRPMHLVTENHLTTDSRLRAELPPQKDGDPVVPMQVTPGPCDGPMVAVIDVDGLLLNDNMTGLLSAGENPVATFREKLQHVAANPRYRAVVLRINSPGGGVTASDIMRRELVAFRNQTGLPVVVCLMDLGTGGAYYVATAASHIMAHPTTVTGGFGVILNLYNMQDTMAQANIEGTPVKAGDLTDLGTPIEALGDEGEKILQQIADEFHDRFREVIRTSRGISAPDDDDLFDGRIFTAPHALEARLIDSIGYLDDALAVARQQAGCPTAGAVLLHRPRDRANTVYDVTPNTPIQGSMIPFSVPGLDRSRLPTFLYLWQPEPTMERLSGK